MLITSAPVRAADTDSRIESSAAKSYVFKTTSRTIPSRRFQRRRRHPDRHGRRSVHKSLAENTVASLPGVKSVDNQLVVSGEQPAEHSDAWITMKVKTALLFHRNVSATGTTVYTEGRRRHPAR
jgi:hyperosmotically inducible periplasmic protein